MKIKFCWAVWFHCYFFSAFAALHADVDPLPSWREGRIKSALIKFVAEVSEPDSRCYVPPSERIATFDQDGTLWVEQPIYTEAFFTLHKIMVMSESHPEWNQEKPYKELLSGDLEKLIHLSSKDKKEIIAVTHSNMSVDIFKEEVVHWLTKAIHPRFKKPFTQLVYQPMLEVLAFLTENGFNTYIVSGGTQEFIRAYSESIYKIPQHRIIGTATKVKYDISQGQPVLLKLPEILFVDDGQGKPEAINLIVGRKPIIAFGNSDGDRQMLEWSQSVKGSSLQLLVHHDDAQREYAYDRDSVVGTFSQQLMDEAHQRGWLIISMKNDWRAIFAWQCEPPAQTP